MPKKKSVQRKSRKKLSQRKSRRKIRYDYAWSYFKPKPDSLKSLTSIECFKKIKGYKDEDNTLSKICNNKFLEEAKSLTSEKCFEKIKGYKDEDKTLSTICNNKFREEGEEKKKRISKSSVNVYDEFIKIYKRFYENDFKLFEKYVCDKKDFDCYEFIEIRKNLKKFLDNLPEKVNENNITEVITELEKILYIFKSYVTIVAKYTDQLKNLPQEYKDIYTFPVQMRMNCQGIKADQELKGNKNFNCSKIEEIPEILNDLQREQEILKKKAEAEKKLKKKR